MEREVSVRVTLDREVDASYVYLADEPDLGWRHGVTVPLVVEEYGVMVNLDFDDDGRITGLEVLGAASTLSDKLLKPFGTTE